MVTGSVSPRSVEKVVVKAVWASGRIGVGPGRDRRRGLTGSEDADAEDESQAECEADPGQGRASQKCADAGREDDGDGQQRDSWPDAIDAPARGLGGPTEGGVSGPFLGANDLGEG